MSSPTGGYYAELTPTAYYTTGAWLLVVGVLPDGAWVVQFESAASSRYQREYFTTQQAAETRARSWGGARRAGLDPA